jgi:cell division transport system permease protein
MSLVHRSLGARIARGILREWRVQLLGIGSIVVVFACLTTALLFVVNLENLARTWGDEGRMTVFLDEDASAEDARAVVDALRATDGVKGARELAADELRAWLRGASKDRELEQWPAEWLPHAVEVELTGPELPARARLLRTKLEGIGTVDLVEDHVAAAARIADLLRGATLATGGLVALVLVAVVAIVIATVRLTLERRKLEVEVMRLVGASESFIRAPFLVEGFLQGFVGALLGVGLAAAAFGSVRARFDLAVLALVGQAPAFLPSGHVAALLLGGAVVGTACAFVALRSLEAGDARS